MPRIAEQTKQKNIWVLPPKIGRPVKWNDPKEIEEGIESYANWCHENNEPFLLTGLALYLKTDRETMAIYAKKPLFSACLKKALTYTEHTFVRNLAIGKVNPIGSIFLLKNWHGYRDAQEITYKHETINDALSKAEHRDVIDGEVVEGNNDPPLLAQPSQE